MRRLLNTRRALVLAGALTLAGCERAEPEVTLLSTQQSPDKLREARATFVVYTGHLTGDPARYELEISRVDDPTQKELAFAAYGGDFKFDWTGPRALRIYATARANVEVRRAQVGDVVVEYASW